MFFNYLKLSLRVLMRSPFLTFINVAGLSVGLATFLLLWPLAEFELKSDQYHKDSDRMIRLGVDFKWTDDNQNWKGFIAIWQKVLATLVGIPVGHFLVKEYLEKFTEQMNLRWWYYAVPVIILLTIIFLSIVTVLLKAARTNPVESLRSE